VDFNSRSLAYRTVQARRLRGSSVAPFRYFSVFSMPSVLKTFPNLGKAFNTEGTEKFKRTNQASAKSDPYVIFQRENQMNECHTSSEDVNSKKNERFRLRPLPLVSFHPAGTSALEMGALQSSPFREFLQIRQFLLSGMVFPCGTGGNVG
jgi:hypothetical protein